ncbi:MAG TPA: sulfite exporter TauE/SafE family protein [Solirubrobacteraceae bacterium]
MLGIKPEIILFGLIVGVLIGLTGIGGGSLMTPLLILVLGVAPVTAIGTDLAYGAITKTFGAANHLRKGTVDKTIALWLAFGSVPGALIGVLVVARLHGSYGEKIDEALLICVAVALMSVAVVVLVRTLLMTHLSQRERHTFHFTPRSKAVSLPLGFILGTILGLTSVGTGALIGVAMLIFFRLTPQRVAGTSVFLGALLLWVAGIAYMAVGVVDFGLMGNILIGSIPGVWVGSHYVNRVPAQALRVTLSAVLLGSALAMVDKAGLALSPVEIIGPPIVVGIVGWLMHVRRERGKQKAVVALSGTAPKTLTGTSAEAEPARAPATFAVQAMMTARQL